MPATLVFDSRTVPVSLITSGFEGAKIKPPTVAVERAVSAVLARPSGRQARWFVSTLIAGCMTPRRTVAEVEALSEPERSRLRRALIEVCEEGARWRSLYGSHLSADERLLAVMVWRHHRQGSQVEALISKIAARRAELAQAASVDVSNMGVMSPELVAKLNGMLTLTTQAQRTATLYNDLIQPYARTVSLMQSASAGLVGPKIGIDLAAFGITKSIDQNGGLLGFVGEPSWMKALTGAGVGLENAPWMKALKGTGLGLEEAPWMKTLRGAGLGLENAPWMKALTGAGVGLENAPWMKALTGAGVGLDNAPWMKALKGVGLGIDITATVRAMAPVMPSASAVLESISRQLRPSEEVLRFYEEADQFMQDWETDALWLLFQRIDIGSARRLMRLSKADVREAVLVALETVCSDGEYVPALRAAVSNAPYLTSTQRIHLDHALEHAERGEYVKASAPLYPGLEGAYREAAYEMAVIIRPTGAKKAPGLVTIVKRMPVPAELKTFIRRAVFSGSGHTIRHGSADGVERRQVLLGVVALAAWLERFAADSPALEVLAGRLSETLPSAAKQVEQMQSVLLEPVSS